MSGSKMKGTDQQLPPGKLAPSEFMRGLRPEYYSDTKDRVAYVLDAPILEYRLNTITSRNETNDFEIFCRKLCERTICPNLRAHTGPDGGGDSKVDTEAYPVSERIAMLFYIGEPGAANERWAFAFSAKERWSVKVRSDVKSIVETGRDYKRIFFVTSRFTRDKDRARIEDELSKKYGIPVTIHDRSWIVKKIIENDRKDIAFNYLHVGEAKDDPLRLGPTDYSRTQQLEDIEKSFGDPEAYEGMETQRVTEALLAAKLSRNTERPRTETDGRFDRAIRLAEADGSYRQELEAKYERIWTAFWWFDDFQLLKSSYDSFEELALQTDHALNLEFLCNLLQLLVNSVIHGHLTRDECKLDERTETLRKTLQDIAANKDRPNNALEAETSLLVIRINQAILDQKDDQLAGIWDKFAAILEEAEGLGEFKAERLAQLVEIAGNTAGSDPAYNELVEKTAEFLSNRKSEAEGALVLLKRAQQLDFDDNFEMIRLLGKAAIRLTKKEYADHLIEALQLLMLAYRSAGLLWAARATCVFLAASLIIESEEDSQVPVRFVPTMKVWAWISLELRHIPDFLFSIQLLNGALATLPLTDESKEQAQEDIRNLDMALGSLVLNLEETDLRNLRSVPDILDGLGLFMARASLLYALGYADLLRTDGSLPEEESDEAVNQAFSRLASQPTEARTSRPLVLNAEGPQTLSTTVLGMTVEVNIDGDTQSIIVAETILGSLEAFFATAIEQRILPHTEIVRLDVTKGEETSKPSIQVDTLDMTGTVVWPAGLAPTDFQKQLDIRNFWVEVLAHVLSTCCIVDDVENLLDKMFGDEAVQQRMTMVMHAPNSYDRVASRTVSRIVDWEKAIKRSYKLHGERPDLEIVPLADEAGDTEPKTGRPPMPQDHRAIGIRSVIDIHAWDLARWRGTAYAQYDPSQPPCVAFLFENEEAGRKIFERWRERFGNEDENEEIYLSVVRRLPNHSEHHYCFLITSKLPESGSVESSQILAFASRYMVMEPASGANLEQFLASYRRFGAFYLLPAFLRGAGPPEFAFDLAILKHDLTVNIAANISEHDIEYVTLRN